MNDLLSHILDKVEGSDDLFKEMKADFSSLNKKVNSHANAINIFEGHLSLFSIQLTQRMTMEENDKGLAMVSRSRKVGITDVSGNEKAQTHKEEKYMVGEESLIHQPI